MQESVAVWVDKERCKACSICVSYCPSGSIAMVYDKRTIHGMMIEVINQNSCIGCRECETHCPDFAIFVASKGFKFSKLTPESRQNAQRIKDNNFFKLEEIV